MAHERVLFERILEKLTASALPSKRLLVPMILDLPGAGQATLRNHLAIDLSGLLGTINLDAAQDLQGLDHVRNSILNYGMADLSRFTLDDLRRHRLANDLKAALLAHEPRLVADTLVVKLKGGNSTNQHIAFDITAEMAAKPVDVPLEFVAEIDTSAGKVALSNLMVRG